MERVIRNHSVHLEEQVTIRTAELSESQELCDSLMQILPVGVMKMDEHLNCVYTNDRWSELPGHKPPFSTPENDEDYSWHSCMAEDKKLQFMILWDEYEINSEEAFCRECKIDHIDGTHRWLLVEARKLEVGGCVATATDITPHKEILPELLLLKKSMGEK